MTGSKKSSGKPFNLWIKIGLALAAFAALIVLCIRLDKVDSWEEVEAEVAQMDSTTAYDEIVSKLGKPYDEFVTSIPEEYVLYYDVPAAPDSMFWIMLDTESKTFLYWGQVKQAK
jgi:hypothetical protein